MESRLPEPSADAQEASRALVDHIAAKIEAAGGWISFARYMELVLYTPGLGYYAGGSPKFGSAGDFVTAPEISPLFGQALARQIADILMQVPGGAVLEAGAGSGRLAADLLPALATLGTMPERYFILELSGELRVRQRETLATHAPEFLDRVEWLDRLPDHFSGCIIGNELLDAMPVHALAWRAEGLFERGVTLHADGLDWAETPAPDHLRTLAAGLAPEIPYLGEVGLAARAWVAAWGERLLRGGLLLIDYGLAQQEYYLPQRNGGTLRCHYRHRAHDNPFWWPGLSDITTHVDFTALAEAGHAAGLDVLGYITQTGFLMNCDIGDLLLARQAASDPAAAVRAAAAVKMLLSPNEMGELFKVIAFGKGIDRPLRGFARGDRLHAL
ncbi:MAG: SAM-dependent methyltransferase [Proteobacteria bacterium]|nr:SAM-dependent methyltransferase [Pseudomonadota bacterium]HQR05141.1 SAM-dependent methyltransferase [Rhodocyclaceae bacterium]